MRVFVHLCIVSFALLAFGLCALAQPELAPALPRVEKQELPNPPWLRNIIQPADGRLIVPLIPAGVQVGVEPLPSCYRFMRLQYRESNEMVPFFTPVLGAGQKPEAPMEQFLPRGICVSRAGDRALLVTAVNEESLDQFAQLLKLLDQPVLRLMLEVMLVDSPRVVQLPDEGGGQLLDELAIFMHHTDVKIYRTFLDISMGQQGVLDLEPYPLPVRGILFSEVKIHPDDMVTLTARALPRGEGPEVPNGTFLTVKNGSALLLNTLLPAMKPVKDEAGNLHNYYLLAGLNACRDEHVHLADGARPLRLFFDGKQQPQLIILRNVSIQALLPHGAWLEDTVTPPASWPQGLAPFAASPSLNALLATGTVKENEALRQFIAAIDVPQHSLVVEGQFIRISEEALRRHFSIERGEDGAWPPPVTMPNYQAASRRRCTMAWQRW